MLDVFVFWRHTKCYIAQDLFMLVGRLAYQKLFEAVSIHSDMIVDGTLSTDEMANQVIQKLIEAGIIHL